MSEPADVLVLCKDLLFSSQIHGAVQRVGRKGRTCLSTAACLQQLAANPITCVIVDLEVPDLDLAELKAAAGPDCPVIGYAPHVREDLFASAQAAGWDAAFRRSQAVRKIEEMLSVKG